MPISNTVAQGRKFVLSDAVAQEVQMPIWSANAGRCEGTDACSLLKTLEDRGTPDQIVLEQHNLTHFSESTLV